MGKQFSIIVPETQDGDEKGKVSLSYSEKVLLSLLFLSLNFFEKHLFCSSIVGQGGSFV